MQSWLSSSQAGKSHHISQRTGSGAADVEACTRLWAKDVPVCSGLFELALHFTPNFMAAGLQFSEPGEALMHKVTHLLKNSEQPRKCTLYSLQTLSLSNFFVRLTYLKQFSVSADCRKKCFFQRMSTLHMILLYKIKVMISVSQLVRARMVHFITCGQTRQLLQVLFIRPSVRDLAALATNSKLVATITEGMSTCSATIKQDSSIIYLHGATAVAALTTASHIVFQCGNIDFVIVYCVPLR